MYAERTMLSHRLLLLCVLLLPITTQAIPKIQHWETANGARVYFVEAPELPIVDVRVLFDAGSARDGKTPGLAQLTSASLNAGAGEWSENQLADRFAGLGAQYGAGIDRDTAWVSLRSLTDKTLLDPALATLRAILTAPTFPAQSFARDRDRMLTGLQQIQQSPGDIAEREFYKAVYGDHPYASPPEGTEESLRALTRDAMVDFHKRYYVARNAVVAIVGALSRDEAAAFVESLVGKLPSGEAASALPDVANLEAARVVRIAHPSTQSHIYVGAPGVARIDPDYFSLYVGNHVLGGGGLVSRLTEEIREKRGLSYSVYSYFMPLGKPGPFQMGLQTRNDQAEQALDLLNSTLATYIKDGPTQKELDAAKDNITGGFPLRLDSNADIVQYLAVIGFYGLPLDYLDTFNDRVRAVTVDAVKEAFQRRVHPASMATVIVGGESEPAVAPKR